MEESTHTMALIKHNTNQLRFYSILIIVWSALIFNIHFIVISGQAVLNLTFISYIFLGFIGTFTLLFPNISRARFLEVLVPLFIAQQLFYFFIPFRDFTIEQALTDGAILAVTFWLIQRLSQHILVVENNLQHYILDEHSHILPLNTALKRIEEEIKEFWQINQPMAIIYCQSHIKHSGENVEINTKSFLENELDKRLQNRYAQVKLARFIMSLTYSSDIVFEYLSGVIICLPESNQEHAQKFLDQLDGLTQIEENITLWAGIAIFPKDGSNPNELIRAAKNDLTFLVTEEEKPNEAPRSGDVRVTISDRRRIAEKSSWVNKLAYQSKTSRAIYKPIKRMIDIIAVSVGLLLISPLLLGIAIAVLIDDGWPIFYSHKRVGLGGKTFMMHKFRSMYKDARALEPTIVELSDGTIRYVWPEKDEDDPRVTRTGRLLRKTSLDELPQLWNVLIGDMSLVGPRPSSWTLDQHTLHQTARLTVKPGITGLWQVSARSSKNFDERLLWDLMYVEKMGLWLDIRILLMTFGAVIKRSGV